VEKQQQLLYRTMFLDLELLYHELEVKSSGRPREEMVYKLKDLVLKDEEMLQKLAVDYILARIHPTTEAVSWPCFGPDGYLLEGEAADDTTATAIAVSYPKEKMCRMNKFHNDLYTSLEVSPPPLHYTPPPHGSSSATIAETKQFYQTSSNGSEEAESLLTMLIRLVPDLHLGPYTPPPPPTIDIAPTLSQPHPKRKSKLQRLAVDLQQGQQEQMISPRLATGATPRNSKIVLSPSGTGSAALKLPAIHTASPSSQAATAVGRSPRTSFISKNNNKESSPPSAIGAMARGTSFRGSFREKKENSPSGMQTQTRKTIHVKAMPALSPRLQPASSPPLQPVQEEAFSIDPAPTQVQTMPSLSLTSLPIDPTYLPTSYKSADPTSPRPLTPRPLDALPDTSPRHSIHPSLSPSASYSSTSLPMQLQPASPSQQITNSLLSATVSSALAAAVAVGMQQQQLAGIQEDQEKEEEKADIGTLNLEEHEQSASSSFINKNAASAPSPSLMKKRDKQMSLRQSPQQGSSHARGVSSSQLTRFDSTRKLQS
jgi:hypothetical protein